MKPICLVQWFHARAPEPERMVDRAFRDTPEPLRPEIEIVAAWNRPQFAAGVQNWMAGNRNTQYIVTVSHGILDSHTRRAIGIGSAPDREDGSIRDDEWIDWDGLYSLVRAAPSIPPHLLTVGCNTADAAIALSPRLIRDDLHAPYLVGVDIEMTDPTTMRTAGYRMAQKLLEHTRKYMYLDEEFDAIRTLFPHAVFHYPVTFVPNQDPRYVNVAGFPQEIGMTFRDYLVCVNRVMGGRPVIWPEKR